MIQIIKINENLSRTLSKFEKKDYMIDLPSELISAVLDVSSDIYLEMNPSIIEMRYLKSSMIGSHSLFWQCQSQDSLGTAFCVNHLGEFRSKCVFLSFAGVDRLLELLEAHVASCLKAGQDPKGFKFENSIITFFKTHQKSHNNYLIFSLLSNQDYE